MAHTGELSENMKVRTRDGLEVGTIIRLEEDGILVEKGFSLLGDRRVPIALVADVRDGVAYLSLTREELQRHVEAGSWDVAVRTLREEASEFGHEGAEVVAVRDNLREGEIPPGSER